MNATILSIGTELLFGQIVNTNAAYISQNLQLLGINVMYHYTVGDNPQRVKETLELALSQTDIVIATGGLGPTQDDLTKEVICETMGYQLVLHEPTMEHLNSFFKKYNRKMTENNVKQAYVPDGGTVFTNDSGTAPGFAVEKDGKTVMAMPGPPKEMKVMMQDHVIPYLEKMSDSVIRYKILRLYGVGESALETDLKELIDDQTDPTLATYAKEGEVALRVASKRKTAGEAQNAVDSMVEKVKAISGQFIYSENDEDIHMVVGSKLIKRGLTLASAESCTGGLFAKRMTDVPGISAVFDRGFVTYSNDAKIEELGVSEETLKAHGAVSKETAVEMAKGAREFSGTDIGISVTGVAGPDGGTEEKPIGLAHICVAYKDKVYTRKTDARDRGRQWNRNWFCLAMYNLVNNVLDENLE